MAEFPELGKHCEVETCKQLDFLPFLCDFCSGTFWGIFSGSLVSRVWGGTNPNNYSCKELWGDSGIYCHGQVHTLHSLEHRTKASHSCSGVEEENEGKLEKLVTGNHLECTFEDCRSRELVGVMCEHCNKNYCLRHRHQVDHQCPGLPQKQTRVTPEERIQQIIGKDLSKEKKGRGGVRNESRAAKVSLMKIKMKATGDVSIPQDERIYLRVLLPFSSKERELPMFFSKHWTVGKIIDKIAEAAKLRNGNNLNADTKLRLFHGNTGEILNLQDSLEHFETREECLVLSGSTVVIEHVDKECTSLLSNLHKYALK